MSKDPWNNLVKSAKIQIKFVCSHFVSWLLIFPTHFCQRDGVRTMGLCTVSRFELFYLVSLSISSYFLKSWQNCVSEFLQNLPATSYAFLDLGISAGLIEKYRISTRNVEPYLYICVRQHYYIIIKNKNKGYS